jgi:hypothetical protein
MVFSPQARPTRDAVFVFLVVILVSFCTSILVTDNANHAIMHEFQRSILDISAIAASELDGEGLSKITEPAQYANDAYKKLQVPLLNLLNVLPNVRHVYAFIAKEKKIFFILDTQRGNDAAEPAKVMEAYDTPTDEMVFAADQQTVAVESELSTDRWGTAISAYSPILNKKGEYVATIGVDVDASHYHQLTSHVQKLLHISLAASTAFSILVAFFVYSIRRSEEAGYEYLDEDEGEAAHEDKDESANEPHITPRI